jgi:hypothetical protein
VFVTVTNPPRAMADYGLRPAKGRIVPGKLTRDEIAALSEEPWVRSIRLSQERYPT